ncbi:hypothetical protein ACJX0J_020317, partial [Zea mays]
MYSLVVGASGALFGLLGSMRTSIAIVDGNRTKYTNYLIRHSAIIFSAICFGPINILCTLPIYSEDILWTEYHNKITTLLYGYTTGELVGLFFFLNYNTSTSIYCGGMYRVITSHYR